MSSVSRAIAMLLARGQARQRTHVVQTVGQLDDDDANILGHRHEHLAQVLDLRVFLRLIRNPREFRYAFDQPRDLVAELRGDLFARDRRIFDDVVQQRGGDRLVVHLELGQNAGDREGMLDVRLARSPALALVGGVGNLIDAHQPGRIGCGVVLADALDELGDRHGIRLV